MWAGSSTDQHPVIKSLWVAGTGAGQRPAWVSAPASHRVQLQSEKRQPNRHLRRQDGQAARAIIYSSARWVAAGCARPL